MKTAYELLDELIYDVSRCSVADEDEAESFIKESLESLMKLFSDNNSKNNFMHAFVTLLQSKSTCGPYCDPRKSKFGVSPNLFKIIELIPDETLDELLLQKNDDGESPVDLARRLFGENMASFLANKCKIVSGNSEGGLVLPKNAAIFDKEYLNVPKEHPINDESAFQWVALHEDEEARKVAAEVIGSIHHVSFVEFESKLNESVDKFNAYILTQENQRYAIMLPLSESADRKKRKSCSWVFSLIQDRLAIPPTSFVVINSDSLNNGIMNLEEISSNLGHILIVDDASYSGIQLGEFLRVLNDPKETCPISNPALFFSKVHLLIPYVTERTLENVKGFKKVGESFHSEIMPQALFQYKGRPVRFGAKVRPETAYYFDHKTAEGESTCVGSIGRKGMLVDGRQIPEPGLFFVSQEEPPYKQVNPYEEAATAFQKARWQKKGG